MQNNKSNDNQIYIISPSGWIEDKTGLDLACKNLVQMGFETHLDEFVMAKHLRFAGTDEQRLQAINNAINHSSSMVMITRGGYGISRILDKIDWNQVANSNKKFIGHSDFTAFSLALLAKTGMVSYAGPTVMFDFAKPEPNDLTADLFYEAMHDQLELLSFESPNSDAVDTRGVLWGGNLAMLCSLIGTPYIPNIKNGILFLEDVGEHPYRIERMFTHLLHSGILNSQSAIVLGQFTNYKLGQTDNGYNFDAMVQWLRSATKTPIVTGLPYGHSDIKATLPIGTKVGIATEDNMAYLLLQEHDHEH